MFLPNFSKNTFSKHFVDKLVKGLRIVKTNVLHECMHAGIHRHTHVFLSTFHQFVMQMNNIWLEILPHHHFPPKNPSRYLSLLISAAWNSLVLVWNALQGISVPANNETVSQQFMRIPQILHLPLLGLAHSRHRRCSIPQLPVFFSVWNRCLLSKFCPSSFALEKNKAWVRSSKAHVSCGIESKELGYQVCYGTQISQISVKGLVTKLIQKWWWLGCQVCCHSQLSGVFRVSNFATFSFHFAFTNRIDFMKVTDTMAATLPDSEDSEEALHLNQRVKKSSAVKTSKLKYKVSLYQITLVQNIACKVLHQLKGLSSHSWIQISSPATALKAFLCSHMFLVFNLFCCCVNRNANRQLWRNLHRIQHLLWKTTWPRVTKKASCYWTKRKLFR